MAATKTGGVLEGLRMLGNTFRSLSPKPMRRLYVACIVPIMTYGSTIWWTGKKMHSQALTRVQNRAMRLICAASRTTPIAALEVESSIPPIHLRLDYLCKNAALHLNGAHPDSQLLRRLPTSWHYPMAQLFPPMLNITRTGCPKRRTAVTTLT